MNIAIFASGNGSNAENIFNYFKDKEQFKVKLFLTNNSKAFVIQRAEKLAVDCLVFNKEQWKDESYILQALENAAIDIIVLSGFLLKIPVSLIQQYPERIINIHPSLLPKYGGKGMYGSSVHEAVINGKEKESGISIHIVNEEFDEGEIISQKECSVSPADDKNSLAEKIHRLEHKHFPEAIEQYALSLKKHY